MTSLTGPRLDARSNEDVPGQWRLHAWSPTGEPPLRRVCVRMYDGAWRVHADGLQPLSFSSGAQAETQARALARGFAAAGFDAEIRVHDACQSLIGSVIYYANDAGLTPAERDRRPWAISRRAKRT